MYKKTELKNGIRVVTHDIKDRDSIAIGIFVGVGARYENDRLKGAAHFLEHMVFKGSRKYSCAKIKEKIEGIGGNLNAFTSEEQTCFYAKIPSKHLETTFDVLVDMVFHSKISPRDLEKEKTVVLEEIKMYHDLPQYFVLELMDSLLWPDHPLGKNIAGTKESIIPMRAVDLKEFHQTHYVPGNTVISICGDIKDKDVYGLINKKLGSKKGLRTSEFLRFNFLQQKSQMKVVSKDIEQMHMALGFPGLHENHNDRYILTLMNVILGGNMSSRLFVELREKAGLAYSISTSAKFLNDTGVFLVRAGFDRKRIVKAVELILSELEKLKKFGVPQNEFSRAKDYLLGQMLLGLEDTMDHMLWLGDNVMTRNKVKTLKELVKDFDAIKKQDIQRVARQILQPDKMNLAIVGPSKEKDQVVLKKMLGVK